LRLAAAAGPAGLPEMVAKMQEAFAQAGERHLEIAWRRHAAEKAVMSDNPLSGIQPSARQAKS
jgi:hypothetical protein